MSWAARQKVSGVLLMTLAWACAGVSLSSRAGAAGATEAAGTAAALEAAAIAAAADALPRRLDFGWRLVSPSNGAIGAQVRQLTTGGSADRAGVRVGDWVLRVGELPITTRAAMQALRSVGRAGQTLVVQLQRGTERVTARVTPAEAPRETHADLDTQWGAVVGPGGIRLRTILTLEARAGRRPAVFIVGWLSCDSVEVPVTHPDTVALLISDIVEHSGSLVGRVDKPGVGDSEGDCAATDFTTELESYRIAFNAFRVDPRVDPQHIVLVGISNGGGFAPLVAGDAPIAGYVTVGGWSKTWFEHMIDLERRRLVLSGIRPEAVGPMMAGLSELHAAYLFDQLTPGDVLRRRPHLRGLWYDELESQYGRPAAYYQQLQRLDLAAAWGKVRAPTLVVWGEYDWIMDRFDQEQIVRLVNGDGVSRASLLVVPGADHSFGRHPDRQAAFDHMGEGSYPSESARQVIDFIRSR